VQALGAGPKLELEEHFACQSRYPPQRLWRSSSGFSLPLTKQDVVHRNTRGGALGGGLLVDASTTAREAGIRYPGALARAVWERCMEGR
jgi:hypothetical protein